MKRRSEHVLTFWVVELVACVLGLVKVIFTGDMCGGSEFAMLCMRLLIFGLPLTGTVMLFEAGVVPLGTSFSRTGEEPEELVRRRLRGFSSSSEQLTPVRERERDILQLRNRQFSNYEAYEGFYGESTHDSHL